MAHEIELKFGLPDQAAWHDWLHVEQIDETIFFAPFPTGTGDASPPSQPGPAPDSAPVAVFDTYLDTADYRLLRHGYALRQRMVDDKPLLTIKSTFAHPATRRKGSLHHRLEWEEPLKKAADVYAIKRWPKKLRAVARELLGKEVTLAPLVGVRQCRHKRLATMPAEPDFAAEVSIDAVDVFAPATDGCLESQPIAHFYELEVELLQGEESTLLQVAEQLKQFPSLTVMKASKVHRAMMLLANHPAGFDDRQAGLQPTMPVTEAARLILRTQLWTILGDEAGVRFSDDIEFVHDMRVAIRRSRVAITLFGHYFTGKMLPKANRALRKTGRRLGAVRDLDVALFNAQNELTQNATAHDNAAPTDPVIEQWQAARTEAHTRLLKWLDSKEYRSFLRAYIHFCNTPLDHAASLGHAAGKSPTPQQVRHVFPGLLLEQYSVIRTYETLLPTKPGGNQPAVDYATIHALRIDCKQLRYNLEFCRELLGKEGELLIARLRDLQEHLGALNDTVVGLAMLDSPSTSDELTGKHQARLDAQREMLLAQTPDMLGKFVNLASRRLVGSVIAQL